MTICRNWYFFFFFFFFLSLRRGVTPRQVFHFTNLPALSPVSILCIYWVYLYKWQGLYWAQRWQNKRLELAPLPRSADRLEALERQTRRCRSKGRRWQAIPCEPVWPSVRLVGKGTSVRIRFGFPFSSKVVDHKSWNINKFWNIRMFGWLKFSSQLISPFFYSKQYARSAIMSARVDCCDWL